MLRINHSPLYSIHPLIDHRLDFLLRNKFIVLLHNMLRRVAGQVWPARVVALLYATYPFAIVWVTVVGTETLNTFLTVAWLSVLTRPAGGAGNTWRPVC